MNKSIKEDEFKNFAESRLNNHLEEVNTLYENEKPDVGVRKEAGKVHRKIFEEELTNKMKELQSANPEEMEKLKSEYLAKLK